MSLIQEALKRKAAEPPVPDQPRAPAPPSGPPSEPPAGRSPQTLLVVLVIVLIVGLIAALIGLSLYLIKPRALVIQAAAPKTTVEKVTQEGPSTIEPVRIATTAVEVSAAEAPVPEPSVSLLNWPVLKLTGVAQSDGQSIAILNGKMLAAGRKVDEVTVREVNELSVVVEWCGERRVLYIDE